MCVKNYVKITLGTLSDQISALLDAVQSGDEEDIVQVMNHPDTKFFEVNVLDFGIQNAGEVTNTTTLTSEDNIRVTLQIKMPISQTKMKTLKVLVVRKVTKNKKALR